MKKLLCLLLLISVLALASTAFAAPFLVCDPPPTGAVIDHYVITGLPSAINGANIPVDSTGTYGFKLDIGAMPVGTSVTLTAQACDLWGDCSAASSPLALSRPAAPGAPTNTRLSPK